MTRQSICGKSEAQNRVRTARMYLDVASVAGTEEKVEARGVAAGNAVLAAIAAADSICCARLGKRHRGQDHSGAIGLLKTVQPEGAALARDLQVALSVKDPAHYGETFLAENKLKITMRAASRLVHAAEVIVPRA
ncbi:hypothetical protein [Phytoactinopolyspora mesophila]|uniref:HEPN domain-containing protein n=1 Tax=Phytoactinopolyspora mesophila TaxID=2650750 RepID=A0A7K3MAU3_9ACTN|nr:hypothetical protein [Phytoactinopolyspora mesophila]NDL60386.1 hypothetical protein [Phytoactinopolyspora mesophila]